MRFEEILIIFACLSLFGTNCQSAVYNKVANAIVADFNRDGKADFLRQEKDEPDEDEEEHTADVFLSNISNGNATFIKVSLPKEFAIPGDLTILHLGDFNGDGKTDFLRQEKGDWDDDKINTADVFLSNISNVTGIFIKVSLPEEYGIPGDLTNLYFGDFDGDGKTDFLRQAKSESDDAKEPTAVLFLSNGDGTFTSKPLPEEYAIPGDKTNIYLADFDGDGKIDFLKQDKSESDDARESTAAVFFSIGDGTFTKVPLPEDYAIAGDSTNLYFADFNGDGKTDFLRQAKSESDDAKEPTAVLFLSNGDGTFNKTFIPEDFDIPGDFTNIYLGDFNGDGRADFLRQEKDTWDGDLINTAHVCLSKADHTFIKVSVPEGSGIPGDLTNLYFGDFDGDGKTDFLRQEKGRWDNDDKYTADIFFSNGDGTFSVMGLPKDYNIRGDDTILHVADFSGISVEPPEAPFFNPDWEFWEKVFLYILVEAAKRLITVVVIPAVIPTPTPAASS